jgi:hypothetical protein
VAGAVNNCAEPGIRLEVPTSASTLHEFAPHGSHKVSDDFSAVLKVSEAWMGMVYKFRQRYKLDGGAVVGESC